jgi:hypothetical protein
MGKAAAMSSRRTITSLWSLSMRRATARWYGVSSYSASAKRTEKVRNLSPFTFRPRAAT